ncbi:MAG: type II toxin-antitoxin system Phd/YefM family antitoxin [Armatimonadetes bacterium]|nr:type II toxin-antitoxin system Phd/YefM family antitoxin [Armatimonadota bacterium]
MRKLKEPDVVVRRGKPIAVILDIDTYEEILERIGDVEALEWVRETKKLRLK